MAMAWISSTAGLLSAMSLGYGRCMLAHPANLSRANANRVNNRNSNNCGYTVRARRNGDQA